MDKTKKILQDIEKLEAKKRALKEEYPRTYAEIGKKHQVSLQYIFRLRSKKLLNGKIQ